MALLTYLNAFTLLCWNLWYVAYRSSIVFVIFWTTPLSSPTHLFFTTSRNRSNHCISQGWRECNDGGYRSGMQSFCYFHSNMILMAVDSWASIPRAQAGKHWHWCHKVWSGMQTVRKTTKKKAGRPRESFKKKIRNPIRDGVIKVTVSLRRPNRNGAGAANVIHQQKIVIITFCQS